MIDCPVPVGARVELVSMPCDPDPIPAGARGTVTGGNHTQVWVAWDNGSRLNLLVGIDRWRRVGDEADAWDHAPSGLVDHEWGGPNPME